MEAGRHLQASGRLLEASGGHLEASGGIWRLLEVSGTPQEASGSHLETFENHLRASWEPFAKDLGVIREGSGRHLEDLASQGGPKVI